MGPCLILLRYWGPDMLWGYGLVFSIWVAVKDFSLSYCINRDVCMLDDKGSSVW